MSTTQLPDDIKSLMYRAAKVAQSLSIPDISLEENNKGKMIRGFSSAHGAPVMINHVITMDLPFQSFAINDCNQFIAKYDLAQLQDETFDSFMTIDDNTKKVSSVQFKKSKRSSGSRFNLEFNMGNADTVRAPKGVKDDIVCSFDLDSSHAATMSKSIKAMNGEHVTIIFDGDELSYEVKSGAKDVFKSVVSDEVEDDVKPFAYAYPFNTLYPALQHNETHTFNVTSRGLLNCKMNGITIYILPKV